MRTPSLAVLALWLAPAAGLGQARLPASPSPAAAPDPQSPTIARCWTSGSDQQYMKWCTTIHGNVSLESPATKTLVLSDFEGYSICSGAPPVAHAWDFGRAELDWGASSITFPSSSTALVTRFTADGRLKLEMRLSRDTAEFEVLVQTTVTNVGTTVLPSVQLARWAGSGSGRVGSFDTGRNTAWINFGPSDLPAHFRSAFSLFGPSGAGVIAKPAHEAIEHDPYWHCEPRWPEPATGVGPVNQWLTYWLGDLGPGRKKTVKFIYRRQ